MKEKTFLKQNVLGLILIALIVSLFIEVFLETADSSSTGFLTLCPSFGQILRFAILFLGMLAAGYVLARFHPTILRTAYRFRYLIAIAILVFCVVFELSGSSIARLGSLIGSPDNGTLFGIPREIRSDEYGVLTPFTCSQYYNHAGPYPYFSETIRGTLTDTGIVYGLPSWSLDTVFRPAYWGYLLLGPAKGLSFFWVSRFLALFLVSFESAMVYTKQNKWLSLTAGLLISLAPAVQWWFAINGFVEILVFGQGALLCAHHYMKTNRIRNRIVLSLVFFWCIGGYILTLYPPWMIPFFYVFAALFIAVCLDHRRSFSFTVKRDVPIIAGGLILLAACLALIYAKSSDTVSAVLNTVYPGERTSTGGGAFAALFKYGAGIYLPISGKGLNINVSESSAFFDFFPLGIIMAFFVMIAEKKKDRILIPLLSVQGILLIYCIAGFPAPIATIMLLNYTTASRAILAVGFINVLLLIRSLSLIERKPKTALVLGLALILSAAATLLCRLATGSYIDIFNGILLFVLLAAGMALAMLAVTPEGKKRFAVFCAAVMILAGGLVNPVQKGLDTIYENKTVKMIQTVSTDSDGLWIVEGAYPLINVPLMVGAPTINSTNVYPDLERWRLLDPGSQYEDVYNRYAHIQIELTDEKTTFQLLNPDVFSVSLNYQDLSKLDVAYVFTTKDYDNLENASVRFDLKAQSGDFRIYALTYPDDRGLEP